MHFFRKAFMQVFSAEHLIKPEQRLGEMISSSEAYGNLIKIALPSVAEMVLMSLIGAMDTMMVGVLGAGAITAVGLTGQPRMLLLAIFFAINTGVTAIVARRKGEGRQDEANRTLRNALVLVLGISILMVGVALAISKPLLYFAGSVEATINDSNTYFVILALFLPINGLTMCINAAQRGVGNTKVTMWVNVISNIVNVIFNFLLIGGNFGFPKLGVAGAAIATAIGFTVGFALSVYSIVAGHGEGFLRLSRWDDWRLHKDTLKGIANIGGNAMLEQIVVRVGFFAYAKIVATLGIVAFAAHQICMQFLNITFTFGDGIGIAGTSLVGQMLGRKRGDLAMLYGKISQRIALSVSLVILSFIIIFRYRLVGLFINDIEVINLAANVMLIVAIFQPFQTSSVVLSGCLRGAGDTRFVAAIMMVCVVLIRPALSLVNINVFGLGLIGAWGASLFDMIIRVIVVYRRFYSGKWVSIKV